MEILADYSQMVFNWERDGPSWRKVAFSGVALLAVLAVAVLFSRLVRKRSDTNTPE